MPGQWSFWHAESDDAETWFGPFNTRTEAITNGISEYEDQEEREHFFTQEARCYCVDDLNVDAEWFLENLSDLNEEYSSDANGLFRHAVTREMELDLEKRLLSCIKEWVAANKLNPDFFTFEETKNIEQHKVRI